MCWFVDNNSRTMVVVMGEEKTGKTSLIETITKSWQLQKAPENVSDISGKELATISTFGYTEVLPKFAASQQI